MAIVLNGSSQRLTRVTGTPTINAPLTVSALLYTANSPSVAMYWSSLQNAESGETQACHCFINDGSNHARSDIYDSGGRNMGLPSNTFTNNTWFHFAVRIGASATDLFVNGTKTNITHRSPQGLAYFGVGFVLGPQSNFYSGRIAEYAVWDKALSDAEITDLYNSGTFKRPSTYTDELKLYLPLVDDPNDDSGNGYDFTAVNSPTYTTHPTMYEPPPATAGLLLRRVA